MPVIDQTRIRYAKNDFSKGVAKIAKAEVYGFKNCGRQWGELIAKNLIFDMFDCTGGVTLNQSEADCLQSKLSEDLAVNCC